MLRRIAMLMIGLITAGDVHARQRNQSAEQPDWMSGAMQVDSVVLQLDSDPQSMRQIESQTLVSLLKSSALTDPAIAKALQLPAGEGRKFVVIDAQVSGQRFVQLTVAIRPGAPTRNSEAAKTLITELSARLSAAVDESSRAANAGIEARRASLEADLEAAKQRHQKARDALRDARASNPDMVNGSRGSGAHTYNNLLQQKQQLDLTLIGSRARLKALLEYAPATAPSNPTREPDAWVKLIGLRQKFLADLKARAEKGDAAAADIAAAEIALAESRALADALGARFVIGAPHTGASHEIPSLRASIAENEARLAGINEQLAKLTPPTAEDFVSVDEINRVQAEENRARNEVEAVQSQLSELRRHNRSGASPRLTVLDGKTSDAPTTEPAAR